MQTFRTCQRVALQQLFLLMRSRIDNQLRIDIPKWKQWLSPQSWEESEEFLLVWIRQAWRHITRNFTVAFGAAGKYHTS